MKYNDENVLPAYQQIMSNIPDVSPLEKVRWLYLKLGQILSYDYTISHNLDYDFSYDLNSGYLNRYQTCIQINKILNDALNTIDGVKATIIERKIPNSRGNFDKEHTSVLVEVENKKIILDLTLDLFLIQSGQRTCEFGYSTVTGEEDVIPHSDTDEMDEKLGFDTKFETEQKLQEFYNEMYATNFDNMSFEEEMEYKMNRINSLLVSFPGFQEAKNYLNKILNRALRCETREFNFLNNENKMVSVFMCTRFDSRVFYYFDHTTGVTKVDVPFIKNLLESGYSTKSNHIYDIIDDYVAL